MSEVSPGWWKRTFIFKQALSLLLLLFVIECIVYTWDHRTSAIIWNILKVQPVLSDEVQTFKSLITVHKIIKDGHPNVSVSYYRTGYILISSLGILFLLGIG